MKSILIATAALSLIGGAAFAQTGNPVSSSSTAPAGVSQGGPAAAGNPAMPADGSSPSSTSMPSSSTSGASSTSMPSGGSDTMNSGSTGAMASSGSTDTAPANYPVCTSKHEDRCVNRSQATTHMASMHHHHMKSTTTTATETQPSGL